MDLTQMMRDQTTAICRIYVGNLPDGITQAELNAQFSRHGTIRGIVINRGFGFVQYLNENSAAQAIVSENGVFVHGRKMSVRTAVKNSSKQPQLKTQQQQQQQQSTFNQQQSSFQQQPQHQQQQQQQNQQNQQQQNQQNQQQHAQNQQQQQQQQAQQSQPQQQFQQPNQPVPPARPQQPNQQSNNPQQCDMPQGLTPKQAKQFWRQQQLGRQLKTVQQANTTGVDQHDDTVSIQSSEDDANSATNIGDDTQPQQSAPVAGPVAQQQQQQQQQPTNAATASVQQSTGSTSLNGGEGVDQQPNAQKPPAVVPQDLNRVARPYQAARGKRGRGGGVGGGGPGASRAAQQYQPFGGGDTDQDYWNQDHSNANYNSYGGNDWNNAEYDNNGSAGVKKFQRAGPPAGGFGGDGGPHPNMFRAMRRPGGGGPHFVSPAQQHLAGGDYPVDCEVIVTNRMLMQYAEAITGRLKRLGLRTDMLFPGDMPLGHILSAIAARGTLYAVRLLPQSEPQRTINVFVVHSGDPNEHRNIPVEDAMEMILNDYEMIPPHIRRSGGGGGDGGGRVNGVDGESGGRSMPSAVEITPTSSAAAPPLNRRHPDGIQTLVNLIADNRPVTVLQYDRVIEYLKSRRELQLKAEIGDTLPIEPVLPPVDPELELQRKILDIMNKPSITNSVADLMKQSAPSSSSIPPAFSAATLDALKATSQFANSMQASSSSASSSSSLLSDPKVQKALDSLLSGSMQF